jgi:histidinol-phosphate aminotransferase
MGMIFSRRSFFQRMAASAGVAALAQLPLADRLFASPEPQRNPIIPGAIQLNSNENPYGPLPSAMKVMQRALMEGNRYPFARYQALAESVARHHGVTVEQVVLGAGSTEHLQMAARAFCGAGKNVVVADPTFESISEFVRAGGGEVRKVSLTSNYAHDLDGMLQRVDEKTGLVYICNPNNPTASITTAKDIETFLSKLPVNVTTLIDEAYFHFADGMPDYRSFMDQAGDRVVVMRTFSKIYGMAGIRLGYIVSSEATAKKMAAFRLPISVSMIAAEGGISSLEAETEMRVAAARNAADRTEFAKQANSRGITLIPSYANFFMLKTGKPAKEVTAAFQQRKVLIGRPFPPMTDYVRVSLGLPEENATFWQAWDQLHT